MKQSPIDMIVRISPIRPFGLISPIRPISLIGLRRIFVLAVLAALPSMLTAQTYNQIDESGNVTQRDERNRNFNPHNNDTTSRAREIPTGLNVWTVDRTFGDIRTAEPDTMPQMFMKAVFNSGLYGEYNTTGNNYTPRQSRIYADRPVTSQFMFTQPYSYVYREPDEFHFTNTLSPLTNMTYFSCGDKQNGEDRLDARFAVNASKRLGIGFDLDYLYARGYFSNQSTSHFGATLYSSYLGDHYQMHLILSNYHQKVSENGGIENDDYIVHPESFSEDYSENEIPTVLSSNWNRNDNQHVFFTHRYSFGFYRKVPMTEEEIKAREFANASRLEHEKAEKAATGNTEAEDGPRPNGRPDDAKIAGQEPEPVPAAADSTAAGNRIKVSSQEQLDSLLAVEKAKQEDEDSLMKKEYVPVTSFIHTLELNKYDRTYLGYATPTNYYANTYFLADSIRDNTKHLQLKNSLGIALLEGFNKWAKAGLKGFVSHELRTFHMDDVTDSVAYQRKWTEHNISVGGKLSKTEGHTLHYNATAELWLVGEDAGQLKADFSTDLNFRLFGDTVQLSALAYFYRLNPVFYHRHYHARNIWWDNDDMSKETRTRIEGRLFFGKTNTRLRVAIEEIQNYTYLGMSYDRSTSGNIVTNMTAAVYQNASNINVLTAQLQQDFQLGPLHWDNIITYQNSSNKDVLPLPALNAYTNLYLNFIISHVLRVDLGADMTYFTKYYAPDYAPQLSQFAVQQNVDSRVELGGYPFVNVYANMHLKHARFFVMMSNVTSGMANRRAFLTPHYPTNSSVLRLGVSWNFMN